MNAKEQEREPDGPSDGTTRESPNSTGSHDHWEEVDEQNQERHDHQQRPLQRLKFTIGGQPQFEGKQHTCKPRQNQTANEQDDETDNEAEFDALLNLWRLEGDEGHDAAKAQAKHKGDKETAQATSPITRQPIPEGELVGDQEFNGINKMVWSMEPTTRWTPLQGTSEKGDRCDRGGDDLPLPPQRLQMQGANLTTPSR